MDRDEQIARAAPVAIHIAVAGIQEVKRLAGDELQPGAVRDVTRPRERVVPLFAKRLRIQLRFSGWRVEPALCKWSPVFGTVQSRVAFFPEPLVGDPLEPGMTARKCRAQHRLVALEQPRLGPAQRAR